MRQRTDFWAPSVMYAQSTVPVRARASPAFVLNSCHDRQIIWFHRYGNITSLLQRRRIPEITSNRGDLRREDTAPAKRVQLIVPSYSLKSPVDALRCSAKIMASVPAHHAQPAPANVDFRSVITSFYPPGQSKKNIHCPFSWERQTELRSAIGSPQQSSFLPSR